MSLDGQWNSCVNCTIFYLYSGINSIKMSGIFILCHGLNAGENCMCRFRIQAGFAVMLSSKSI